VQPKVALGHPEHFQTAAQALGESLPGAFWTNQFDNIANWRAHYEGTGPEVPLTPLHTSTHLNLEAHRLA
jgi:cysteine synthase